MASKIPKFMSHYSNSFAKSQILEKIIPREIFSPKELQSFNPHLLKNFSDFGESDLDAVNKGLLEPIYDLLDRGGKRWRPVLGMVFAECYQYDIVNQIDSDNL